MPHLAQNASLRVHDHIRGMGLQELRGQPEAGLAASRRANDAGVQVTGVGRIFWTGVDRQIFRPGENDVVPENRVYEGLDVLRRTP